MAWVLLFLALSATELGRRLVPCASALSGEPWRGCRHFSRVAVLAAAPYLE
jgi:hypothetical protein